MIRRLALLVIFAAGCEDTSDPIDLVGEGVGADAGDMSDWPSMMSS